MTTAFQLVFATNNENKVKEIKSVLNTNFEIISLKEAGITIDIPEPYNTLYENALEKSSVIYKLTNKNCFSEDTGLEVEALNGEPGVKSARYAENETEYESNIAKLLFKLKPFTNKNAQFKTVISLIINDKQFYFEGLCKGKIIDEPKGKNGFGYDAVFVPEGSNKTFAEMDLSEKNLYSHRKKAILKLTEFLSQNGKNFS